MLTISFLVAVFFVVHASANSDSSDHKYAETHRLNGTSGTNTYAQAINYGQTHPKRDGGSWSGWYYALNLF